MQGKERWGEGTDPQSEERAKGGMQHPALSEVLLREAAGIGCSILRFRESSCVRPMVTDTASCAFGSPRSREAAAGNDHTASCAFGNLLASGEGNRGPKEEAKGGIQRSPERRKE